MKNQRIPCKETLRMILRYKFNIRYKQANKSKFKYRDPTYNDKRIYLSRLLAQFLHDDVLIISVDECSLRSDALANK